MPSGSGRQQSGCSGGEAGQLEVLVGVRLKGRDEKSGLVVGETGRHGRKRERERTMNTSKLKERNKEMVRNQKVGKLVH